MDNGWRSIEQEMQEMIAEKNEEIKKLKLERAKVVKQLKSMRRRYVQKNDATNAQTHPVYNGIVGELKTLLHELGEW